jgi:hypothetical protein
MLLARLWLRRIGMANRRYYAGAQPFRALEVIRLHSIFINQPTFNKVMALCPNLLTLDLRSVTIANIANCDDSLFHLVILPPNLRSVTIANCEGIGSLRWKRRVPSLRSFRYRGNFVEAPFFLPRSAVLNDLYIQFAHSISEQDITKKLNKSFPKDLSGLNVLTICCHALPVFFSILNFILSSLLITCNF